MPGARGAFFDAGLIAQVWIELSFRNRFRKLEFKIIRFDRHAG